MSYHGSGSTIHYAADMANRAPVVDTLEVLRALASPKRLQILEWLRDPVAHFPPQRDGDLVDDGVCVIFIAEKLAVAQPTATSHLQTLARAGLLTSKRIGQWTFYQRDESAISAFTEHIQRIL
ncbi:ArsR family transcriptional regulator [Kribbella kalugense]|uniref:ArsR family transcriptional regulator n=2 Tax=Kribbella kalugense TaxID=2512221 RepID=A0A4R8A457_9ACTN|nr:ArsR family transcriptional regulator [Kribbella kalugense]